MGLLFDSVILIDFLRGVPAAADLLVKHPVAAISKVTWIEVLVGCDAVQETIALGLFENLEIFPVTEEIAMRAVTVRRTTKLKLADAVIYATALEHNLTLITRNARDFTDKMPNVRIPYTV